MKTIISKYLLIFTLAVLSYIAPVSFAETAIIVHPGNNTNTSLTVIKRIFLGKAKAFNGGGAATPVELSDSNPARSTFNQDFLGKTDSQMKSYWGRLVFTGKATTPLQAASDAAMIESVSKNPNLVGYIDAANVSDAVKVVHTF